MGMAKYMEDNIRITEDRHYMRSSVDYKAYKPASTSTKTSYNTYLYHQA